MFMRKEIKAQKIWTNRKSNLICIRKMWINFRQLCDQFDLVEIVWNGTGFEKFEFLEYLDGVSSAKHSLSFKVFRWDKRPHYSGTIPSWIASDFLGIQGRPFYLQQLSHLGPNFSIVRKEKKTAVIFGRLQMIYIHRCI